MLLFLFFNSGENYGRSKGGDSQYGGEKAESNGRPEYDGPPGMVPGGLIEVMLIEIL